MTEMKKLAVDQNRPPVITSCSPPSRALFHPSFPYPPSSISPTPHPVPLFLCVVVAPPAAAAAAAASTPASVSHSAHLTSSSSSPPLPFFPLFPLFLIPPSSCNPSLRDSYVSAAEIECEKQGGGVMEGGEGEARRCGGGGGWLLLSG